MYESFQTPGALRPEAPFGQPPAVTSEEAAAAVIRATMAEDGGASSTELAAAERVAGLLFQPESVEAAVSAAREQAHAEHAAEHADLRGRLSQQLAASAAAARRFDAVMRLCEARRGDELLLVAAVALAAGHGTTALDTVPMTLTWTGTVDTTVPGPLAADIVCTSSYGQPARLTLDGAERAALASLLVPLPAVDGPCPTDGCGTDHDYDASDPALRGWIILEVAGVEGGPRWYCSPWCVEGALARAGDVLAAEDQAAAVDPDQQAPDPLAYGPSGYRCGCGRDAHSNLSPCRSDDLVGGSSPALVTDAPGGIEGGAW